MPAWNPTLDGWDVGPPLFAWAGCHLHPASRAGGAGRTLWLRDDPMPAELWDAWASRMKLALTWTDAPILRIHGGGLWDGRPWVVTDPLRRGDLWSNRTHGPGAAQDHDEVARQVLHVLAWAHAQGFGHGRIAADALVVGRGDTYFLAGLGFIDLLDDHLTWVEAGPDPRPVDLLAVAALVRELAHGVVSPVLRDVLACIDAGDDDAGALADALDAHRGDGDAVDTPPQRLGRYLLESRLGSGGMGVVWRARDPELDRVVAVKVHHPSVSQARDAVARFRQEARAAGRLDHPALVRILDFGNSPEGFFYAMELVEGPDLKALLAEVGRLDPRLAASWTATLARGLAHAHGAGIIHRDLKPANVLVERGINPRVTDFGLALAVDDDARLTQVGQVMGTPAYMAPEQAAGRVDQVGPRSDVYSLGALLYEMLTGRQPFHDAPPPLSALDRDTREPTPVRSLRPEVPIDLAHIVARAMAPAPRHRYPTMDAFGDDLERFLVGEPVSARAPSAWRILSLWVRRHRTAVAAVAGAGLVLTAAATTWAGRAWATSRAHDRREAVAQARVDAVEAQLVNLVAEGRSAEASRRFAELVALPELQGTAAWSSAWLAEAGRRAAEGDGDGEREALARVWLATSPGPTHDLALTRIAGSWRAEWRYLEVDRVLRAVTAENGDAAMTAALAQLALETARYRWSPPGVGGVDAVIHALAAEVPVDLGQLDLQLDKSGVLTGTDERRAWRWGPAGPERLPALADGEHHTGQWVDEAGLHVVAATATGARVVRLVDGAWQTEGVLPVRDLVVATPVNLGVPALVLSTGRLRDATLARRSASGWALGPELWTEALNSDFAGALSGDFDRDGLPELAVALGAWNAYDLRLYRTEPGPRLQARRRLGTVHRPARVRLADGSDAIAVATGTEFRNAQIFGDERARPTVGVYRLQRGELVPVTELAVGGACGNTYAGDVDGDGLDDVVNNCATNTLILHQARDGRFEPVVLGDLRVRGVADLDGDGDAEVLGLREEGGLHFVIAGMGSARRGPLVADDAAPVPPPPELGEIAAAEWRRQEALVSMGLYEGAVSRLATLADEEPAARPSILRRRAQVLARVGLLEESAAAWAEVPGPPQAEARAAALAAVDRDAARALIDKGDTDPALRAVGALSRADLDLRQGIDPHVLVLDPGAVRVAAAGAGLRVTPMGQRTALRVPLELEGHRLALTLDLVVELAEWDGNVGLRLVPEGGGAALVDLRIGGRGGGGRVATQGEVTAGGVREYVDIGPPRRVAADDARVHLRVALDDQTLAARHRADVDGSPVHLTARPVPDLSVPSGRYVLEVGGVSVWAPTAIFTGRIERVVVDGARFGDPPPPTTLDVAAAAVATGDARSALQDLGNAHGPLEDEIRIQALLDEGRGPEAARVFADWATTAPTGSVERLLRTRPEWTLSHLVRMIGPGAVARAWEAWAPALIQLPEDVEIGRDFAGWAEAAPEPPGPSEAHVAMVLHLARVARAQGRVSLAATLAERAEVEARRLPAGESSSLLQAQLLRERATVAALRGDEPAALATLRAMLELHPAPEAAAELIAGDSALATLRERPAWDALVTPYLRYGATAR